MAAISETRPSPELGLTKVNIVFNESWLPFEEWQNCLVEADSGVSTRFQHLETTFSFRFRILDRLWAGLPIVSTEGDLFGDLIATERLEASVPELVEAALVRASGTYLFNPKAIKEPRPNVARVRQGFFWSTVRVPIVEFCRNPIVAADRCTSQNKKSGGGKSKMSVSGRENDTSTLSARPKATCKVGVSRDLARVAYCFRNGGPAPVLERFQARRDRKRDSRP